MNEKQRLLLILLLIVVVAIGYETRGFGLLGKSGSAASHAPEDQAHRILAQTTSSWVALRKFDGKTLIYFTQIVTCSAAVKEVRYGIDTDMPDQTFPVPTGSKAWPTPIGTDTQIYISAPLDTQKVSVQITYKDGTTSPVQTYRAGGGA